MCASDTDVRDPSSAYETQPAQRREQAPPPTARSQCGTDVFISSGRIEREAYGGGCLARLVSSSPIVNLTDLCLTPCRVKVVEDSASAESALTVILDLRQVQTRNRMQTNLLLDFGGTQVPDVTGYR